MTVRVGINGFGRIGRNFFRALTASGADIELVAANDLGDVATMAHLLKYDSILGRFPGRSRRPTAASRVGDQDIKILAERDPANLPWGDLGVDVVIESTGFFTKAADARKHVDAGGAKKVIISAPATDEDITIVHGRQRRRLRPGQAHDHLQRVVHDELPRPAGQGARRRVRDRARPDDHDPRLHPGPEPAGRARTRICAARGPPRSTSSRPPPAPPRRSAWCCRTSRASWTATRCASRSRPARPPTSP